MAYPFIETVLLIYMLFVMHVGQTVQLQEGGLQEYVFLGANLISLSSKKEPTVPRSSSEGEYRAMANTATKLTWIFFLLKDMHIPLVNTPQFFL